jgi:hypothetical protein
MGKGPRFTGLLRLPRLSGQGVMSENHPAEEAQEKLKQKNEAKQDD